jgi:hypothetical protein
MLKLRSPLAVILAGLAVAACATVLEGTTQTMTVTSLPEDASCVLERREQVLVSVSATPASVEFNKDDAPIRITCSKPGYLDASRVVLAGFESYSAGNLFFGGLVGVVIDASTGAVNQYPSEVSVMLPPATFADAGERDAFFDILKADAEYRAVTALDAANASALCRKNPEGQDCVALLNEIEDGRTREQALIESQRREAELSL